MYIAEYNKTKVLFENLDDARKYMASDYRKTGRVDRVLYAEDGDPWIRGCAVGVAIGLAFALAVWVTSTGVGGI